MRLIPATVTKGNASSNLKMENLLGLVCFFFFVLMASQPSWVIQ